MEAARPSVQKHMSVHRLPPARLAPASSTTYRQSFSTNRTRSNPRPLDGASVSNNIYVFVEPTTNIDSVEFLIDGVSRHTENGAPYDLPVVAPCQRQSLCTNGLSNGYHTFSARITKTNGSRETISAQAYVGSSFRQHVWRQQFNNLQAIIQHQSNPV